MGMFDYVEVDVEGFKGMDFQTNSAENKFNKYKISEDRLYFYANGKWYKHPWFTGQFIFYRLDTDSRKLITYFAEFCEGELLLPIEEIEND